MEAAELSKLLQEKWGVSAAAPVMMGAMPAAAAPADNTGVTPQGAQQPMEQAPAK